MFDFLKKKLKGALGVFSKKAEEVGEVKETPAQDLIEEKLVFEKPKEVPKKEEKKEVPKKEVKKEEAKKEVPKKEVKKEEPKKEAPKVEARVEVKPVPKVEVKSVPKVEEKPIQKVEVKPIPKVEVKPVPKVEVKPVEKPVQKPIIKPVEAKVEVKRPEIKTVELPAEEKKGFFGFLKEKITTTKIDKTKFEELFWDLELAMMENGVAIEVVEKIKEDLGNALIDKPIPRGGIETVVTESLKRSIEGLFIQPFNIIEKVKEKKPFVICFVGVNGSGKTTSIAKVAKLLQDNGLKVVMAAADTFRAAAIDQLQIHADNLGIKLVKHDYGADAAAVAFDAIKHAEHSNKDVVIIDTAGRLHSNVNLMEEMKKIIRVAKPDMKIFVGEAITGNDCIEQARQFNDAIGIDGILLSKQDIDEKGGASISVSYVTQKPILFIGTGQEYSDLKVFDSKVIVDSLFA